MDFKKQIKRILSVNWLQTLRFNFYYFPVKKAIHLPILVGYKVHVGSLGSRGGISVPTKFGQICYGLKHDPFHRGYTNSYWSIEEGAKVTFLGSARFSKGTVLNVFKGGHLVIGDLFTSNANLRLSCAKSIFIGNDVLLGWDITIMDNDGGHVIRNLSDNSITNIAEKIIIENHVWVSAEASILKGKKISTGSIVGYKANVCGLKSEIKNVILAGNPAKIIKEDVVWLH